MKINGDSTENYLESLPESRKKYVEKLINILRENLPEGFEEILSFGMPSFVVSLSLYPDGYHSKPGHPLPFISVASQKEYIALYHLGIYQDKELAEWFKAEYQKYSDTNLNMGKSCIRFNNPDNIPWDLIAELARKIRPKDWVRMYEREVLGRG